MILDQAEFWHWWLAAVVFMGFEMVATAYFFLWLGASSAIIGGLLLLSPDMSWEVQWAIWAIISVVGATGTHLYKKKKSPKQPVDHSLNQRGSHYVGRVFTLEDAIVNGQGKIKVDDSIWKIEAKNDFDAGTKVKVTGLDGTVLLVELA